jgi:hypothetical protein
LRSSGLPDDYQPPQYCGAAVDRVDAITVHLRSLENSGMEGRAKGNAKILSWRVGAAAILKTVMPARDDSDVRYWE